VREMPRLPDTALRLIQVLNDPASSIEQIVNTIRYDPTVTADLLRLCNSAHFGLARRVRSIDEATVLLGTAKVLQLVISGTMQTTLARPQSGYGLPAGALWEHSVTVALGCQLLGQRCAATEAGLLFTAGLLHDLGKVVLNEYVANEYAEIMARVQDQHTSFVEAEREVLGFTHADIGARLGQNWSLPEPIVRCIRHHHDPDALPQPDLLVDLVHLADAIGLLTGIGCGEADGLAYAVRAAVLRRRALDLAALEKVGVEVVLELKSVRRLFATR
jgi:putative nucleotidyltransferase with HDIG domain